MKYARISNISVTARARTLRNFNTRSYLQLQSNESSSLKTPRRVGALRGGFTGFLLGVALTGVAAYYYLFDEYQVGQRALLSDVIKLRQSIQVLREEISELKSQTK